MASALSIPDLRTAFTGRVVAPEDPDYDQLRTVFAGGIDRRPAVIVRAVDAADVARTVRLARETGLELAVRAGGHSAGGHSVCDDGIVLDLRDMKRIDIDVPGRMVWAEAGLSAAEYTTAVGEHGLVTGFGDTGSVGIGGITLSGGIGFLVRKYGMSIDNLLAAEVVTADGDILHVDTASHPDLFWAIRGGGGNFGVVTKFKFQLHELPEVVGGMLILPASVEVIDQFMKLAEQAPDELSTIANVMPAPPMPFLPPEKHGELIVMALMTYAGPAEDGERVLAPFRALAEPLADMLRPIRYAEMFMAEDQDYHPTAAGDTLFIDAVDAGVAETILEHLRASDATLRVAQLRMLGGAMAKVPAEATAFAHRTSRIMANVAAFYDGPEDQVRKQAWVSEFAAALRQQDTGLYVAFLNDEPEERVRQAYPGATWDRLAEVKRRYDPTNLFHRNQNVPPAQA